MSDALKDAAELFGAEALSDRKRLRKAYARLVKQHPPDADPVMFQRIRAALEAAQEALDRPAEPEESLDLDALIAGLTPDRFDTDRATLERVGLHDANAALAAMFLAQAVSPDSIVGWLVDMRQRGLAETPLLVLTNTLLDARPSLADDPRLAALSQTASPRVAAVLGGYRVRALIRDDRFDAGFALWQTIDSPLRGLDVQGWIYIADAILFYAAERTPKAVLTDLEAGIEDIGFDIDEQAHADLTRGLHSVRVLQAIEQDPALPASFAEALRRGQRTSPPGVFSSLRQVAALLRRAHADAPDPLEAGMQRLAIQHPGAYEMIRDFEEQLIGRRRYYLQWAAEGERPGSLPEALEAVVHTRLTALAKPGPLLTKSILYTTIVLLAVGLFDLVPPLAVLFGFTTLGIFAVLRREHVEKVLDPEDCAPALDDLQRTYGLWRHELIAQAGLDLLPEGEQTQFDNENADLRCLSPAHGYRSTCMMQPTDEDAGDDADDDAGVDAGPSDDEAAGDTKEHDD